MVSRELVRTPFLRSSEVQQVGTGHLSPGSTSISVFIALSRMERGVNLLADSSSNKYI